MSEANIEVTNTPSPVLPPEVLPLELSYAEPSRFTRIVEGIKSTTSSIKRAGEIAIIGAEVLPVNEVMRYGAAGAAQAATGNSLFAAAVFGVSTLVIEGLAAEATADLMDTNHGKRVFEWLNDKTNKVVKGRKMSMPVEVGVAYFGGSAVVMAAKQIEDPTRTKEQTRRHGRLTAAWMSGVLAVQWGLTANGIDNPTPVNIAAASAVTAGAYAGIKLAQRHDK